MAAPEGSTTIPLRLAVVNCPIKRLGNESGAAKTIKNAKKYDTPRDIGCISLPDIDWLVLDYIKCKREKASVREELSWQRVRSGTEAADERYPHRRTSFVSRASWHFRRRAGASRSEGKRPAAHGPGPG